MTSSSRLSSRLALCGLVLLGLAGCRSRVGDPCRCASDCGSGLQCYAMGEKVLKGDACFKPGVIGVCEVSENIDTDSVGDPLSDMPIRDDLPSKRDLAGPGGSDSDSATGATDGTTTATTDDPTSTTTTSTSTTTSSTSTTDDTTTTGTTADTTTTTSTGTTADTTTTTGSSTE
jgi:hypothetical protein